MTNTPHKYIDAMGYCIELSRMLHDQEDDVVEFRNIVKGLLDFCGDDKYLADWVDNDPLFSKYMMEVLKWHKFGHVEMEKSIRVCYTAHCKMNKENFKSDELYIEQHKGILLDLYGDKPPESKGEKPKGLLRFFKRG